MKKLSSEKSGGILGVMLSLVLTAVSAVIYFVFLWFWWGDGLYMMISVPAFFGTLLLLQWLLKRALRPRFQNLLEYTMLLATPILAVCCSFLLAQLCGIRVEIF